MPHSVREKTDKDRVHVQGGRPITEDEWAQFKQHEEESEDTMQGEPEEAKEKTYKKDKSELEQEMGPRPTKMNKEADYATDPSLDDQEGDTWVENPEDKGAQEKPAKYWKC